MYCFLAPPDLNIGKNPVILGKYFCRGLVAFGNMMRQGAVSVLVSFSKRFAAVLPVSQGASFCIIHKDLHSLKNCISSEKHLFSIASPWPDRCIKDSIIL